MELTLTWVGSQCSTTKTAKQTSQPQLQVIGPWKGNVWAAFRCHLQAHNHIIFVVPAGNTSDLEWLLERQQWRIWQMGCSTSGLFPSSQELQEVSWTELLDLNSIWKGTVSSHSLGFCIFSPSPFSFLLFTLYSFTIFPLRLRSKHGLIRLPKQQTEGKKFREK